MIRKLKFLTMAVMIASSSCGQSEKKEAPDQQQAVIENDLPSIHAKALDGTTFTTKDLTGKVILVLFQPDCDHCQREAKQIHDELAAFKSYQLYFLSAAPSTVLEKFSIDYNLNTQPNVHFASTSVSDILTSYGSIDTPSLYLYSEGKLIQQFNGEVDISVVIKYL